MIWALQLTLLKLDYFFLPIVYVRSLCIGFILLYVLDMCLTPINHVTLLVG